MPVIENSLQHKGYLMKLMHLFFLITIGLMSGFLSGCGTQAQSEPTTEKAPAESRPVEIAMVSQGDIDASYAATAPLEAEHEATIVAEVAGVVLQMLVEEGDPVKKGQVLARLDADKSRLQVLQAEGELKRLKNEVTRNERLITKQLVSRQALEQSQFDYATRKADVDVAKLMLRKSDIIAPFDGVVTHRLIKQGQLLKVRDPIFQLANFSLLKAKLHVPERNAVALKAGQEVSFTVDVFPEINYHAIVERIAPVVEATSGTVSVTVAVDNHDGRLRPGLFTRLNIVYDHISQAALVPKAAVLSDQGKNSIFIVEDGKAYRKPVMLGADVGGRVQVVSGVEVGATVVVAGQSALTEGVAVKIISKSPEIVAATVSPAHG